MTTLVFVRRFLADYARNPVNLLLLAARPGGLRGRRRGLAWPTPPSCSAAPAAPPSRPPPPAGRPAFLAGIAMYFQTARHPRRRPAARHRRPAGRPAWSPPALLTGLALAVLRQRRRPGGARAAHRHRRAGPGGRRAP